MGFRFSKSIRFGPARLNLSKRGVGMSVGEKGLRVGTGPRGSYTNVSIPGTGISYRSSSSTPRVRSGQVDPEAAQGFSPQYLLRVEWLSFSRPSRPEPSAPLHGGGPGLAVLGPSSPPVPDVNQTL